MAAEIEFNLKLIKGELIYASEYPAYKLKGQNDTTGFSASVMNNRDSNLY
jgi:hypothetical protein